jgi:hypothetical protein
MMFDPTRCCEVYHAFLEHLIVHKNVFEERYREVDVFYSWMQEKVMFVSVGAIADLYTSISAHQPDSEMYSFLFCWI